MERTKHKEEMLGLLCRLPELTSDFCGTLYAPESHLKAIRLDYPLVVGIRGAGKSYWTRVLHDDKLRKIASKMLDIQDLRYEIVSTFGFTPDIPLDGRETPEASALVPLQSDFNAALIWKTVVAWQLLGSNVFGELASWRDKVRYFETNQEEIGNKLYEFDNALLSRDSWHLVIFDGLDRCAEQWATMKDLVRGLLRCLVDMKKYRRIRLKAFIRPDLLDSDSFSFADGSKLKQAKAELTWPVNELYSLLWTYLANDRQAGEWFRNFFSKKTKQAWSLYDGHYGIHALSSIPEKTHRSFFEQTFAGPWMGKDHRRGYPYTWLPSHLADAHKQVSPRSFLAALRKAGEDSQQYEKFEYPLHYESIKRGVQAASQIRVDEIKEDYPWIKDVMERLQGLVIPVDFGQIKERWSYADLINVLKNKTYTRPLPDSLKSYDAVREFLEEMGFFEKTHSGFVNMPDVYRVAFGLGRKGGVRPIKR